MDYLTRALHGRSTENSSIISSFSCVNSTIPSYIDLELLLAVTSTDTAQGRGKETKF